MGIEFSPHFVGTKSYSNFKWFPSSSTNCSQKAATKFWDFFGGMSFFWFFRGEKIKHDHQKPITRVHSIPETVCKWAKLKGAGYASEPKNFLQVLAAHSLKPTASLPLKIGRSGQILVGNFIFQLKWFFREFFAPRTFRSQNAKNNYLGMSRPGG